MSRIRYVVIVVAIGAVVAIVLAQSNRSEYTMVKVGGEKNQCECTHRLER
jgi:hypothetical protein